MCIIHWRLQLQKLWLLVPVVLTAHMKFSLQMPVLQLSERLPVLASLLV